MSKATRLVTTRDFLIFQLKLVLDGAKDVVVFWLALGAYVIDLIRGRGKKRRVFYTVLRLSERFDLWLNLHGIAQRLENTEDGLFGASKAGSDTLVGQVEQMVRGGDTPRKRSTE
jgi:hypothetical protein